MTQIARKIAWDNRRVFRVTIGTSKRERITFVVVCACWRRYHTILLRVNLLDVLSFLRLAFCICCFYCFLGFHILQIVHFDCHVGTLCIYCGSASFTGRNNNNNIGPMLWSAKVVCRWTMSAMLSMLVHVWFLLTPNLRFWLIDGLIVLFLFTCSCFGGVGSFVFCLFSPWLAGMMTVTKWNDLLLFVFCCCCCRCCCCCCLFTTICSTLTLRKTTTRFILILHPKIMNASRTFWANIPIITSKPGWFPCSIWRNVKTVDGCHSRPCTRWHKSVK